MVDALGWWMVAPVLDYEERTVEETISIFNPYASGRSNASDERPPTLKAFIETAMRGASR